MNRKDMKAQKHGKGVDPERETEDSGRRDAVRIDRELKRLVPDFLARKKREFEEIRAALEGQDFETVRRLCHTLKGASRMHGFDRLGDLCGRAEDAALGRDAEALPDLIQAMSDHLAGLKIKYVKMD